MKVPEMRTHPVVRSKAKSIAVVCVGRNWNWDAPHVLLTNMLIWVERMQTLGYEVNFRRWQDEHYSEDAVFMCPGFNLPGGKYVNATKNIASYAAAREKKVILYACDVELLKAWTGFFAQKEILHGLVTNFQRPWHLWRAQCLFYDPQLWYDEKRILPAKPRQPKHSVAYVGWPKPDRFKVLKKIGYEALVLMGFGADKQDEFPAVLCEANTPWPFVGELYPEAAWHLCISDADHAKIHSAVSRPMEAWACGRPCAFHKSFVESRKYVKWDKLREFIFDDAIGLHDISKRHMQPGGTYDLEALAADALRQKTELTGSYYSKDRPEFIWSDRFLKGDLLSHAPLQHLGDSPSGPLPDDSTLSPGIDA